MVKFLFIACITLLCSPLLGQHLFTGKLIDEIGRPIPYATVCDAKGNGVLCDQAGNFHLIVSDSATNIIIASAIGYQSETLMVADNNIEYPLKSKNYELNELTIVAHQCIENKSTVSAITTHKKEILNLQPHNVNEVLQTKVGFTNNSGYQTPLVLRGISGKNLLVLRNGVKRFSSYPAGYMSHIINVYDLERIEVEKGAASVIYGTGAMAGIINLIDKSPFKQNGLNVKVTTGYGSVNNEKNILTCGGWSDGKFAIKAGVRYRNAGNYKYPNGTKAENSFYTDKDLFVSTGYKLSENQNIVLTSDFHNGGPWGKPVGFNGTNYMKVQTNNEKSNNYNLKYQYNSQGIVKNIESNIFFSNEGRELIKNYYAAAGYKLSYVETTHFSDYYYGANINAEIKVSDKYHIKTGAEVYSFHISTPIDAVDYIEGLHFNNRVSQNARNENLGIYIENNINLTGRLKAVAGIRFNNAVINQGNVYSISKSEGEHQQKNALNGNIAFVSKLKRNATLKLNLARSFRMPETTELFTDSYSSNGIIYGNPNIKPEYCNSLDLSYRLVSEHLEFEASPFLWLMNNMINKELIGGLPGTNFSYVNIGKTRLFGGEIYGKLKFNKTFNENDNLSIQCGFAYLNGTDISLSADYWSKGIPLNYVPPLNAKGDISYNFILDKTVKCNFMFRSTYYTQQLRLGEDPYATPAYFLFGCNLSINLTQFKTQPAINVAINNLTNKEYYCYQSYLPSEGRDVRIFLTLTL